MANECNLPGAIQPTGASSQPTSRRPERVSSRQLLVERGELIFEHDRREYQWWLTQYRKLILTA